MQNHQYDHFFQDSPKNIFRRLLFFSFHHLKMKQNNGSQYLFQGGAFYFVRQTIIIFRRYRQIMKTKVSHLLTAQDSENQSDAIRFKKSSAFFGSNKTHHDSPKNSMTRLCSENDLSSEHLSGSQVKVNELISQQREKIQNLTQETAKLKHQLSSNIALNQELADEKDKILNSFRQLQTEYDKIRTDRAEHLQEISEQKGKITCLEASLKMSEEQVEKLEKQNKRYVEEINFQHIIEADLKRQILLLKNKVGTIINALRDQGENKRQLNEAEHITQLINEKLYRLQGQMKILKEQLAHHENSQLKNKQHQLFVHIEELKKDNAKIKNHSQKVIKTLNQEFYGIERKYRNNNGSRDQEYQKIIKEQEQKIKALVEDMMSLSKKNHSLLNELEEYRICGKSTVNSSISMHTNSHYLTKMVRQNHLQIKEIKQELDEKDQEINRLQDKLSITMNNLQTKDNEIQAIQEITSFEKKANQKKKEAEIFDLEQKNTSLNRKIDQMSRVHQQLKSQLKEKDRIIMNYVQSQRK